MANFLDPALLTAAVAHHRPEADWTSDDWETPAPVAQLLQSVLEREVLKSCVCWNNTVIEIGAGRGAITKFANFERWKYTAIEAKPGRFEQGKAIAPGASWQQADYLQVQHETVDAFIGNLPFSKAMDLIGHAAGQLWSHGCMVLLLPTAFFQTQKRGKQLEKIGLHITAEVRVRGRVAYERNGDAVKGRQCEDSIFVLRFERGAIEIVDPYDHKSVAAWREA